MKLFSNRNDAKIFDNLLKNGDFSVSGNRDMIFYVFSKNGIEIKVFEDTVELVSESNLIAPVMLDLSIFKIIKIRSRISSERAEILKRKKEESTSAALKQLGVA